MQSFSDIRVRLRDWWSQHGPNKYILTLIIFVLIMLFIGDQSWWKRIARSRQIAELEEEYQTYQQGIDEASHDIELMQNRDSLIRFARERYHMHTADEDVYLIEKK
mgnify:FL=1